MDISELEDVVTRLEGRYRERKGAYEELVRLRQQKCAELAGTREQKNILEQVQMVFQVAAEKAREEARRYVEELVTHALQAVFGDGVLDFLLAGFRTGVHVVGGEDHVGIVQGRWATARVSTVPAMLVPHWQTKNTDAHDLSPQPALESESAVSDSASRFMMSDSGETKSLSRPTSSGVSPRPAPPAG